MKQCKNKNCKQVNPQSSEAFAKKVRNPDGLQNECRACVSLYKKQLREKLGETLLIAKRESYHRHKHKRKYTDEGRAVAKEYKQTHKEEIKTQRKIYTEENREYINERQNEYILTRRMNDLNFKLAGNLRTRLRQALKRNSKVGSAVEDLGCSIEFFKQYIEAQFETGMSWDNYSPEGWHIDHIVPLSKFDLTDREQFLKACHYTNQRPMWAIPNIVEGARKGVCHQKLRRDATLDEDKVLGFRFDLLPKDFEFFSEELGPEHRKFIERYEWLGTIGFSSRWCFTARHEGNLAGVVLIGEPTMPSKYKQYEALIQRGACSSWAPKNLNSKLIMFACNWMVCNTNKRLFMAYSDSEAGEIGTIYQACNFLYLGNTFGRKEGLQMPNGKIVTERQFTCTSYMKRWAKELGIEFKTEWLKPNGFQNLKAYPAEVLTKLKNRAKEEALKYPIVKVPTKGKYALILGKDRREDKILQKEIELRSFPYPKRKTP